MITYKIHLLRTGSTFDGTWRRYVGQDDLPLCDKGAETLKNMALTYEYPPVDMVFTSPMLRCAQTADILYPDAYAEKADGLKDMDLGSFSGKSYEELKGTPEFEAWLRNSVENAPPGGEKADDFTSRVVLAAGGIITRMMEEKITRAAVITHGGVIMTLLASIGLPKLPVHEWSAGNGCGYTLMTTPQMWMRDRSCEVFSSLPYTRGGGHNAAE